VEIFRGLFIAPSSFGLTCSYVGGTLWRMGTSASQKGSESLWKLKDDVVRVRVSAEHKQALMRAAEREGLELSAWLRQLALRAAGVLPDAK
jgi:hypothetical protein